MDQEQERSDGSNSGMAFISGLCAGALIGTGLGLLFAPRKGSELREQLSDAATTMGKTVAKTADDVVQRGRSAYDRARDVAGRQPQQQEAGRHRDRGHGAANRDAPEPLV